MQRPQNELVSSEFPKNPKTARRLLAYMLRATDRRVKMDTLGRDRYNSRSSEIESSLVPLVVSEQTCLGFYRAYCARFGVSASGGDSDWGPIELWLPEGRMQWDRALAAINYSDLRLVIHECPEFFASFATCRDEIEGEDEQFSAFPDPSIGAGYRPRLPQNLIQPRSLRAVWTLTSDMHHGADEKTGNVNMFRRHRVHDPLSGQDAFVPFLSGNAVRGLWRDMVFGRWLQLLGIKSTEVPPFRAHAFFAGGSVEKGADGAKVNNLVRDEVRTLCPPWDLLAGCIEQQIMQGRARVGDATLVCRENAWKLHEVVNPGISLDEWAASLPEACTMTKLRLGTRHKHADLHEPDGVQMLFNTEILIQGNQMVHTFQLWGIDGVRDVTAACLADLLADFRSVGCVGAGNARGLGQIAFDPYVPGPECPPLPDPNVYLEYVERNKQAAIDWVMSPKLAPEQTSKPARVARGPKGKKLEECDAPEDTDAGGAL